MNFVMSKTEIAVRSASARYRFEYPFVIPVASADGRPLKPPFIPLPNKYGYPVLSVRMRKLKISMQLQIHQIVGYQKYGEEIFKEGFVCRHKDNNKLNFYQDNILIGTYFDNSMDNPADIRNKISFSGKIAGKLRRVIPLEILIKMKADRGSGMTYSAISNKYGFRKSTLYGAIAGKTYLEDELGQP